MRRRGSLSAELRTARAEDLPLVSRLLSSAGLPTRGVAEHFGDFVVAIEDGRLRGAVGLELYGASGLLRSLIVSPESRGRGGGGADPPSARPGERARAFFPLPSHYDCRAVLPAVWLRARAALPGRPGVMASSEFKENCCQTAVSMKLHL